MIFQSITISGFRSFKEPQRFEFPQGPGLYFMQGRNDLEPRLQANGAGKSSIWDALTWCLFGKTSTGLKAGDVSNWETGKGTRVDLEFELEVGGGWLLYQMTRTWSPNSWTLSNGMEPVTDLANDPENLVLATLGLDYTTFHRAVLTAQNQPTFLDLDENAKATVFGSVLGLDSWVEASAKASRKASDQDSTSRGLEAALARIGGKLETLRADATDDRASQDWEVDRQLRVDEGVKIKRRLVSELSQIETDRLDVERLLQESETATAGRRSKEAQAGEALENSRATCSALANQASNLTSDISKAKKARNQYDQDGSCPTCGRPLDDHGSHGKDEAIADITRELDQLADDLATVFRLDVQAKAVVVAREAEYERVRKDADGDRELMAQIRATLETLDGDRRKAELQLDRTEQELKDWRSRTNPFVEAQIRRRVELEELEAEELHQAHRLDRSHYQHSLFSFWVRGFKELRLSLISEALTELEVEVNNSLEILGLQGWKILFAPDRQTKGGKIQKGFSVGVVSPHSPDRAPWKAWSGGEAQRLRLAGAMGMADLVRSRLGVTLELEIWDEPSTGLSPEGVRDMLCALEARAQRYQRQVWIVDHTSHSFGGFAGGALIIKDAKGSRIESF